MKAQQIKADSQSVAYSYLRFSSPEQAKGDSIRRQVAMCEDWCRANKVRLDSSIRMRDEGISAFTGDHRTNPDRHALAGFLELVRQQKIAKGSYLVVENLDRLSREDTVPALHLFTGILHSGIRIVQLDPEAVYHGKSDSMDIMRAILELSRGNSESRNKSRRMRAVWGEKRKAAAESKAVISRSCPAWIRVEGKGTASRYALVPAKAEVVRRVFRMAIEGSGIRLILKALQAEGVPPISRKPWSASYVKLLLASPAAFGQFTPRTGRGSSQKRKPSGPPIAGYYPAAVAESEFYAAQAAVKARRIKGGRPRNESVNVFSGLLWDARTRSRLHTRSYSRDGVPQSYLVPRDAVEQRAEHVSFPLAAFEGAIFEYLVGIDPREVLPGNEGDADKTLALSGRLAGVEGKLARMKAQLRDEDEAETLIELVRELEKERRTLADMLADARAKAASPAGEAWGEFRSVSEALAAAPDKEAARLKLRAALRRMVDSVWVLFMPGRGPRLAFVQVVFAGGKFQNFAIAYRPRHVTRGREEQGAESVVIDAVGDLKPGDFDLRNASAAADLEAVLTAITAADLEAILPTRNQRKLRSRARATRQVGVDERHERWAAMRAGSRGKPAMSFAAIADAEGVSQSTVFKALK